MASGAMNLNTTCGFGVKATFYILDIFGENWRIHKKVGHPKCGMGLFLVGRNSEKTEGTSLKVFTFR